MKSKIIFSITSITLLILFGACDKASTITDIKVDVTDHTQPLCLEARDSTSTYEIDRVCAEQSIHAYAEYIETVKTVLDTAHFTGNEEKLIRGTKLGRDEIQEIANLLNADSTAIPYIMLAFKEDSSGVYADMIFTIESGDGSRREDYRYFDFTQPCPTYCPKKYSHLPN